MDKNSKTLVLILAGMVVLFIVFVGVANFLYPAGFTLLGINPGSEYSYMVSVTTTEPLYNATFFIPLPSKEGNSPVGLYLLDGWGYGVPEDMDMEIYGEGDSVFLKAMIPETESLDFGITVEGVGMIETISPIDNSYIIMPVRNLESGDNGDDYQTYIFASYESSPSAEVNIGIKETGRNVWKGFSERSNSFDETVSVTLTGPSARWNEADVHLSKGIGDYTILF